jgi:Protein of unknown function (DUF3108)
MTAGAIQNRATAGLTGRALLQPRNVLAITLALSAMAHLIAYFGLPNFLHVLRMEEGFTASRFDAVITARGDDLSTIVAPPAPAPQPAAKSVRPKPRLIAKPAAPPLTAGPVAEFAPAPVIDAGPPEPANISTAEQLPSTNEPAARRPNEPDYTPRVPGSAADAAPAVVPSPESSPAANTPASDKIPNFPGRISIGYRMTSNIADGVVNLSWKRNGDQYEIDSTVQPSGIFTSMFVGTFHQVSRGDITAAGIRPRFFSLKRGDARADTAEFLRATNELKIIKHGETHLMPLPERMQDMQSFLFQMAHDVASTGGTAETVVVQVTNARKVYEYRFRRVGEENIDTKVGTIATIHLKSEATNPEDVYEVWLAPEQHYMPVKLKFFMGKFPVEQTVNSFSSGK